MTSEVVTAELKAFAEALDGPMTLVVGWWDGDKVAGGRVELTAAVAERFRDLCRRQLERALGFDGRPYEPLGAPVDPGEFLEVPMEGLDDSSGVLELTSSAVERDAIAADQLPEKSLLFHAYVVSSGDEDGDRYAFLRKSNAYYSARRGRVMTRYVQTLQMVSEPVFGFDDRVDIAMLATHVIVFNETAFQYLFKHESFVQRHVPEWISGIARSIPLSDAAIEDIQQRARTNTRLRRRIEAISQRGHLAAVSRDEVMVYAAEQGIDTEKLIDAEGNITTEHVGADDVLKLLNEDLVTGRLSGAPFTVERKSAR